MKKIFSILLALTLVLSVGLVTGTPVQASVSQPQVTVSPVLTGEVAEYTIVFDINSSLLSPGDSITVDFPDATTVPATGSYSNGDITINGANVTGGDVSVADVERKVTMLTPISIGAPATVTVVFTTAANITNPTPGDYTLKVNTSGTYDTTPVVSAEYAIRDVPTVTGVSPGKGNVGGTMWVVIAGTGFMGDEDTNDSDTTISFGVGADALQTKYISANEINVQIEVVAEGTFTVRAQTPAGTSTTNGIFIANDDDPPARQVDVWSKYTPTDLPFDANTLVFHSTTDTITAAIAAASDNYVLVAHAAEYEEDLVIDVEGLTLMSVSGSGATTIKGIQNTAIGLWPLAEPNIDIRTHGVKIHGFTIQGPDYEVDKYSSGMVIGGDNVEIYDNDFEATPAETLDEISQTIQTYWNANNPTGGSVDGLNIHDNTFAALADSTAGYEGIYINHTLSDPTPAGTVTIADNTFTGEVLRAITTERSKTIISDNTIITDLAPGFPGGWIGILVRDPALALQDTVSVVDNTVKGSATGKGFQQGIRIGTAGQTLDNISVTGNTLQDNETGIQVRSSADSVVVNYNDIDGNSELGLENTDGATLNALYNWWGHAIGPNHDTLNPGGQLNAVTGNADFSPWLYKPLEEFAQDAPCLAGSVVLANEAEYIEELISYAGGWNSFSTPFTLDGSANTVSELLALTAESDLFILRAQCFNPTTQQWVIVIINNSVYGADYQINPGEGLFIQVSSSGSLPILVATTTTQPPMRNLVAGWNLIGLPSLGEQTVAAALSGVSYSMVLSPKPPNDVAWIVPPDATTEKLLLGKAYWLAMSEPGILFGSTYTPVADDMTWDLNQ